MLESEIEINIQIIYKLRYKCPFYVLYIYY